MKRILSKIINLAIETKDYEKLRYIGQSLDVMLFEKQYEKYYPLFEKICIVLEEQDINLLGKLYKNYDDLDNIGLTKCITFCDKIKDNPVPSLDEVKEKLFQGLRWYDNIMDAEAGIEFCYKFLTSKNGVETDKEQPEKTPFGKEYDSEGFHKITGSYYRDDEDYEIMTGNKTG